MLHIMELERYASASYNLEISREILGKSQLQRQISPRDLPVQEQSLCPCPSQLCHVLFYEQASHQHL